MLLFNVTETLANTLFVWSNVLLVFGAAAVLVGTIGVFSMGAAKEQFSNERISGNEVATARANAEAETAKEGAAKATARAAELANETETLRNENLKLKASIAPRALSKEQFDAIQTLHGKVQRINVAFDTDAETTSFAMQIAVALQKAGITANIFSRDASAHSTGSILYDQHAFQNPDGKPTKGEPIMSVLDKIGLGGTLLAVMPNDLIRAGAPLDVPTIIVGGKPPSFSGTPYLGKRNAESGSAK